MSAGGVFKMIANDGKADKLIMATELLNQRLKKIMCYRKDQGLDSVPTLVDIERSHILYVNAHFKPFASIGYEYNKIRTNTGNPQWGNSVQFSIPQFGDFFNDMVINVEIDEATATTGTVPDFPAYVGASDQVTTTSSRVSATTNPTSGVYTKYTYEYVNSQGTVVNVGSAARNFVRYCEYPGVRFSKRTKFDVNNNPLDDYTTEALMFYMKHHVAPNKEIGWKRLVGQEVPVVGHTDLLSVAGTTKYSPTASNLVAGGSAAAGAPANAAFTARKQVTIVNGPQTPKLVQPALSLWQPLIFWFNRDVRLSIASVAIPYGQRFITIDIAPQSDLLYVAPGDLFLRLTTEEQLSDGTGKGTAAAIAVTDVKKTVTLTPVLANGSVVNTQSGGIKLMELYINNIFVNSEIHDIYIKRIGFSLIRVHRFQSTRTTAQSDSILLNQFKYPIETVYLGLRPAVNVDPANPNQHRDWHNLTRLTDQVLDISSMSQGSVMTDDTVAYNATSIKRKTFSAQQSVERIVYPSSTPTVDTLQVDAHGISIYAQFSRQFFRDYQLFTYGGDKIMTNSDLGSMMLNFCLFPGTYQPSGHFNISRAREFYIKFTSSYVGSTTPCDMLALGIAINFLLISDGSAVIRYST